ncbi:UNVERIFIED_ORG: hypothetical protein M2328_006578 [Rhodococcus erythropolis]
MLLERLANRVESAPAPGSAEWKNQWNARESADGRERLRRHLLVKIAIATAARVDPTHDIEMARQAGIPEADIARASGRKTQRRAPRGNAGLTPTQTTLW